MNEKISMEEHSIRGMKMETIEDVFNWLGRDCRSVPYYLHLLNLRWSPEGAERDMGRYVELARHVKQRPELLRLLIRDSDWRSTLVGNALVILLRAFDCEDDLVWRLKNYTWVAPQVAVGIGLIARKSTLPDLETILVHASQEMSMPDSSDVLDESGSDTEALEALTAAWEKILVAPPPSEHLPKTILSAYCALKFLGHHMAEAFEQTSVFHTLKAEDRDGCIAIAEYHWDFWNNVVPILDQ